VKCPICGSTSAVLDSRHILDGHGVKRRRQCRLHGHRWTTTETAGTPRQIAAQKGQTTALRHEKAAILEGLKGAIQRIAEL